MAEQNRWVDMIDANPNHSVAYIERFQKMEAAGDDLAGEARFIDTMAPRHGRILDAGCGPGRVASILAELGHDVVGVDADPVLIAAAVQKSSGPKWFVGDLAELDLASEGITEGFDVISCVGNVMPFLAPSTRKTVLARMRDHLVSRGRIVVGFGSGRGYPFDEFFADAIDVGLVPVLKMNTWDMYPLTDESDFLVAVLAPCPDP